MKKEFYKVELDFSKGSAYEYRVDSEIPTKITFGRQFSGKFQTGEFSGIFSNRKLHDIMYLIKRGCEISDIEIQIKSEYK